MSTRHIAAEAARLSDLTPEGSSGGASKRFRQKLAADGFTVDEGFRLKPGYLYTVVRAISARVNQNYDGWPSDELKKSYKSFIGKPVFVNHENHDPTKARGVVVASRYAENGMDKYIEVVQEIDAKRFPKLAHEIKSGGLDSVSMGAEAGFTICSYCHNKATEVEDMCDHVLNDKGKTLSRLDRKTGKREDVLIFESCHKISFFELSYVFEPADETAVASKVVVAGLNRFAEVIPPKYEVGDLVLGGTRAQRGIKLHNTGKAGEVSAVLGPFGPDNPKNPTLLAGLDDYIEDRKRNHDPRDRPQDYEKLRQEMTSKAIGNGYYYRLRKPGTTSKGGDQHWKEDNLQHHPASPKFRQATLKHAEDLAVPAPPGTPTTPQSVIDSTPVVNLSPATELTGHEAPGLGKSSAFDADIAEITRMAIHRHAGECPPGADCSRNLAQGEQITQDSPNNPVNQVSYDPASLGQPGGSAGGGAGGGGGSADGDGILPGSRALYDQLLKDHPGANIGGYRPPGDGYDEHANGALDFMTTDDAQAAKVREKAFAAGAPYVIWKQQQWNPDGSVSGMEDRGDPTQNHFDHVHIAPISSAPTKSTAPTTAQPKAVAPTTRAAGKYTKDDFNHPSGKKPWERDAESDTDDAAAIEIEAMMLTAGASDDYWAWKDEHGEEADKQRHGPVAPLENRALSRWVEEINRRTAEALTDPTHSQDTTRRNTINTYLASHAFLNGQGAPKGHSLDFGAGWGDSASHPDLNAPRARFHTLEPHANEGMVPDFKDPSHIDDGTYRRIHSLNVLNVAERGARDEIVGHIGRILAPGGHAVITTRGFGEIADMLKNNSHLPGPDSDPGSVIVNGNKKGNGVRKRYQKGFTPDELHQYVSGVLGDGYAVTKTSVGSAPAAVHIVRNADNIPAVPPRPIGEQVKAARTLRSTAMKKVARSRAMKLAYGETEAPIAVDTLREEGTAPEDDNNDLERYVDPPDFKNNIDSPEELQDPDLSQASRIDRQQEEQGQDPTGQDAAAAPQQQFMNLQIPLPAAQQSGVPMAASPAGPPQQQQPMQVAASLLDYFDGYYGRRIANWLDAVEASRGFTPEEAADYRRQAARLSTLENSRELSTTNRTTKGTANMARNSIVSRNKVATTGRRQHFAEGPLTDGGDRSRNDQGEQEEAFISQTPPEVAGDYVTGEHPGISNTEHNLVARVQQGRAQLLRDAQQLASLQQRRAVADSGGPKATVVNPTVNTGPEGEALTGDGFVSANPNDGVVATNPKDASLRAFQAFDGWLAQKTGKSSRRHTEANIKKAAAQFAREAGVSPQMLFPALGIVLREARKNDKQANTKGAKMRKRADEKLEVAAPDGRVDVEAPVSNTTSAEAQASQFDLHDFGNNAGDNVAKPDLSTDQNWAPGEASKTSARVKTAGGLLAMRCAEGMIAAGLEPESRERKYQLAAEFESMNRGLIQDRVALLERFAAVRQAERRKVASGSSRGAARSPIPAGLGGGTRTASAGMRMAAHDPSNDSSLFI